MKHCRLLGLISLIVSTQIVAAPCVVAPLTTYTASGFTCEVDSAVFSNFNFFLQNSGGGDVLAEGDITVSPLIEPSIVGLRFSGDFQATGGPNGMGPAEGIRINAYRFFFDVTKPGSIFTDIGSRLNDPFRFAPNPFKFGDIFASNYAANDAALALVHDTDADLTEFDALNSERLSVTADNMIQLAAGASAEGTVAPVGFVSLGSADYLYQYRVLETAVPEPRAWLLSVLGLAGLAVYRRRLLML